MFIAQCNKVLKECISLHLFKLFYEKIGPAIAAVVGLLPMTIMYAHMLIHLYYVHMCIGSELDGKRGCL